MKLASITLPIAGKLMCPLWEAHATIEQTLIDWCCGFTRVEVLGAWVSSDGVTIYEQGHRYEFTSPDTKTARGELRALAYRIKTISDEEAIFIVHANGNTEIVR
jgi:hypothetical protein